MNTPDMPISWQTAGGESSSSGYTRRQLAGIIMGQLAGNSSLLEKYNMDTSKMKRDEPLWDQPPRDWMMTDIMGVGEEWESVRFDPNEYARVDGQAITQRNPAFPMRIGSISAAGEVLPPSA
jgi:hypothetical protein